MTSFHRDRLTTLATAAILLMAMLWGSTFFSIKALIETVPVADMLAVRFTISAVILGILGWRHWRMPRRTLIKGIILGVIFTVSQLLQTFGLQGTSASVSGFLTGLYVVATPILAAIIFKDRIPLLTWLAVIIATVGLTVLSLNLSGGMPLGFGELLTVMGALGFASHIVAAGHFAQNEDAMSLTLIQTVFLVIGCWIAAIPGGIQLPTTTFQWGWLLYLAIFCGSLTIFLQIWAQAHVEATKAAVIMATEPVWAALFAIIFGGEHLTGRIIIGGTAILAAMILVILVPLLRSTGTTSLENN
ncbi:MAG: DMT family transporter [Propionibacteriaceae bacterium]